MKKHRWFRMPSVRWTLVGYDLVIFAVTAGIFLFGYRGMGQLSVKMGLIHTLVICSCVFLARFVSGVYRQIWRYGGVQSYIRLIVADGTGFIMTYIINKPLEKPIPTILLFALISTQLLLALSMRMSYRYIYKCAAPTDTMGRFLCRVLEWFSFGTVHANGEMPENRIKVAIVGAGNTGISLGEEMLQNVNSPYNPVCFVDSAREKIGRMIHDLPVLGEDDNTAAYLKRMEVQEVIFALPNTDREKLKLLYGKYSAAGYKVKNYDYPVMSDAASGKRVLREFDIGDLLFRKQVSMDDAQTGAFYRDKVILITGGGGSIGSELCRQLAKMRPKQIVLVDIYENGAYDVQQELRIRYGKEIDVRICIVSYTNRRGLERVFRQYRPEIVINAAAHKHVPLMEDDCIEAVENNVFGTLNTVELSERYGVKRFIQVSTDKAVNPTNVMGATKRMCEFIVLAHGASGTGTTFSATRFGNVLGSAGSVVPLFKKQIANGGPVTITDKRIIRYFMTIPEASQLVLQSGAIAKPGELFVLDMGKPVKILDLAESMIRLSGLRPGEDIEIRETGLRPGEKLYEELLIRSEELGKTENDLIFIERDTPISMDELAGKLSVLREATESDENEKVRQALEETVPTFRPKVSRSGKKADVFEEGEIPALPNDAVKGKRILVVDDVSMNREVAAETLSAFGMIADIAESGEDAIRAIRDKDYDYILMDLVMPGMDGYEAARRIRTIRTSVPIIAMTASADDEAKQTALGAGMTAFLPKPLHLNELLAILATLGM